MRCESACGADPECDEKWYFEEWCEGLVQHDCHICHHFSIDCSNDICNLKSWKIGSDGLFLISKGICRYESGAEAGKN